MPQEGAEAPQLDMSTHKIPLSHSGLEPTRGPSKRWYTRRTNWHRLLLILSVMMKIIVIIIIIIPQIKALLLHMGRF